MKIKRQDTSIPVFSYVMDIFLFSHPLQLLITQHSLVQFFLHPVNEIDLLVKTGAETPQKQENATL
mgnify:CR=1 FL=1